MAKYKTEVEAPPVPHMFFEVGDVVETPSGKVFRHYGQGKWAQENYVSFETSPGGGIPMLSAVPLARRPMFPKNLETPLSAYAKQQTLGTVIDTPSVEHPVRCLVTTTGTTGRVFGTRTITLDTEKYYEASIKVTEFAVTNYTNMGAAYFGIGTAPSEGVMQLKINEITPVVGNVISIRFRPSTASTAFRFGFGCNASEKVTKGDVISFEDFCVYEIPSLTEGFGQFSYSAHGPVGFPEFPSCLPSSCLLALGDSWSNDSNDWPTVCGTTYRREMVVSAAGGRTLAQIATELDGLTAAGNSSLLRPGRNIPGAAVIVGGINDIVQDETIKTVCDRAQALIDGLRARYIRPLFVVQPLATNAASYSAARLAVRNGFAAYLRDEGCDVLDLQQLGYIAADGTADTTWMLDESGAWIHPSSAGSVELARLIDAKLRDMDRAAQHIILPPRWQI